MKCISFQSFEREIVSTYLSCRPPRNTILSAYLLQSSGTYAQSLCNFRDGKMKVLREQIKINWVVCPPSHPHSIAVLTLTNVLFHLSQRLCKQINDSLVLMQAMCVCDNSK
jgi:hypothetical protein